MSMPIDPSSLGAATAVSGYKPATTDPSGRSESFANTLVDAVDHARALESASVDASRRFAAGDPSVGIHEVVLASEKANIAVRYASTLRNKVIDAYRELMATQV